MDLSNLKDIVAVVASSMAAVTAVAAIAAALRSGLLRRIRLGAFEIEASPGETQQAKALIEAVVRPREDVPFETEQLAQYYSQVLAHSKISFWFSLIFASLGFVVIVIASFMYSTTTSGATIAQIVAGVIMDAVSVLFFVQSKSAQAKMAEFFDKLRLDRQQAESRKLCESVSDSRARDALRIHLALRCDEAKQPLEVARAIMDACLTQRANNALQPTAAAPLISDGSANTPSSASATSRSGGGG